jgi:hypothetical protein
MVANWLEERSRAESHGSDVRDTYNTMARYLKEMTSLHKQPMALLHAY